MPAPRHTKFTPALLILLVSLVWVICVDFRQRPEGIASGKPHKVASGNPVAINEAVRPEDQAPGTGNERLTPATSLLRGENQQLVFAPPVEVQRKVTRGKISDVAVFHRKPNPPTGPLSLNRYTLSAVEVAMNPQAVRDFIASDAESLRLPLRADKEAILDVKRVLSRGPQTQTLIGKVRGEPYSDVVLVFHDGAVGGDVAYRGDNDHYEFGLSGNGNGDAAIRRLNPLAFDAPCGHPDHPADAVMDAADASGASTAMPTSSPSPSADEPETAQEATAVIDTVVGYDRASRIADGGVAGIEARIIASVDQMNEAFRNSLVTGAEVVLLGTIEDPNYVLPGRVAGDIGTADELANLNNETDGILDTVSNFRKALGADQNSFVITDVDGSAGIAYRPGRSMILARTYMTSTRITFAHEFAHNIGARHAWGDSSADLVNSVSNYGWRFDPPGLAVPVRTIMAYDWGWGEGVRIPYYSNPKVLYAGAKTGAEDGYNATGDPTVDPRLVSGGYAGNAGRGYDGSNPLLGARDADYLRDNAMTMANRATRVSSKPVITSSLDIQGTLGQAFSYTITTDLAASSFSARVLPPGLSLNSVTGVISGTPTVVGTFTLELGATNAAGQGIAGLTIRILGTQSISLATIPTQLATATLPLSAQGGASGNPVTFEVISGPATLTGTVLSFTTAGTVSLRARQAGNADYLPAADLLRSFEVVKAPATVLIGTASLYYNGLPRPAAVTTTPEGLTTQVTYNGLAQAPVEAGTYAVTVTVDDARYQGSATGSVTLVRPQIVIEQPTFVPLVTGDSEVNFGWMAPGTAVERKFTILNAGSGTLDLSTVSVSGAHAAAFSCIAPPPATLAPNSRAVFSVRFTHAQAGHCQAMLHVHSSDASQPVFTIPVVADIDLRLEKTIQAPASDTARVTATKTAWEDTVAGVYEGPLWQGSRRVLAGALENLVLTAPKVGVGTGGTMTAKLRLGGQTMAVKGSFDATGLLSLSLPQKDGSTIALNLQLQQTAAGERVIRGPVTWNGVTMQAELTRTAFDARHPAPADLSGSFTLLLPGQPGWGDDQPGGDGWATVTASTTGVVKVAGKLGDGTAFTESAALSASGGFLLYADLYPKTTLKGLIGGAMQFRPVANVSDFDGTLQWRKPADAKELQYTAGFQVEVKALGSRFSPVATGQRVLAGLADAEPNASLCLIDPSFPEGGIERPVSWLKTNAVVHYGPETLKATANAKTGLLSGSYKDPATQLTVSFQGVAFQKQNLAAGLFGFGARWGALRILPATGLQYRGTTSTVGAMTADLPVTAAEETSADTQIWSAAAAGTYAGLLTREGGITGSLESFVVTAAGDFTASLWISGSRYSLRGRFTSDGTAVCQVERKGLSPLMVTLQLRLLPGSGIAYELAGTVSLEGVSQAVSAQRLPVYGKAGRAPQEGSYTLAVLAGESAPSQATLEPAGDGYGTLKVSAAAGCTGTLVLADGTKVTLGGHVSADGQWSLYRALYGTSSGGFIAGRLSFRDVPAISDIDGEWQWHKPAGLVLKPVVYPGGFTTIRQGVGMRYTAPLKGTRAWAGLDNAWYNLSVHLAGPDLSPSPEVQTLSVDRVATWTAANQVIYFGPDKLTLTFNTATGLITGSYVDAARGISQPVGAVLLQKQGLATGTFVTTAGQAGRFSMQPMVGP